MIGEIRDEETARTAVHAANSGILVLATLHAPTAAAAIQTMRGFGVPNPLPQRQPPRHRQPATAPHARPGPPAGIRHQRQSRKPSRKSASTCSPAEGTKLYAPMPAESNQMTGYTGRTGVFELMPMTREIRTMISEGRSARDIRDKAITEGMIEFRHSALLKVARGVTSTEEVFPRHPDRSAAAGRVGLRSPLSGMAGRGPTSQDFNGSMAVGVEATPPASILWIAMPLEKSESPLPAIPVKEGKPIDAALAVRLARRGVWSARLARLGLLCLALAGFGLSTGEHAAGRHGAAVRLGHGVGRDGHPHGPQPAGPDPRAGVDRGRRVRPGRRRGRTVARPLQRRRAAPAAGAA